MTQPTMSSASAASPSASATPTDAVALRHPLFWLALAALVLNDHVLKGAGLLPEALTGKLSDVAGLIVAPIVVSALFAARTRRRRALAFALVAGWFTAANLFAPVAAATAAVGAWFGLDWAFWVDPTDLVALAVLPLSWHLAAARDEAIASRAVFERVALGLGLAACVASPDPPPPTWSTAGFLVNRTEETVEVRVRYAQVSVDCVAARANLSEILPRRVFGPGNRFVVEADETLPLDRGTTAPGPGSGLPFEDAGPPIGGDAIAHEGSCEVAIVSAPGLSEFLVFWDTGSVRQIPLVVVSTLDEEAVEGGLDLVTRESPSDADDTLELVAGRGYAIEAPLDVYQGGERCQDYGTVTGFDWSTLPFGEAQPALLERVEETLDGCIALRLLYRNTGERIDAFLCVPPADFPFLPNSEVVISHSRDDLHIVRDLPLEDGSVWRTGELRIVRASSLREGPFDVRLEQADAGCLGIRMECGGFRVPAAASLIGDGGLQFVHPGQAIERTDPDGRRARLRVGRTESMWATRASCGAGRDVVGARLEALVVYGEAPRP